MTLLAETGEPYDNDIIPPDQDSETGDRRLAYNYRSLVSGRPSRQCCAIR